MQNICTDIIDIDYGKVRKWNGNYHAYLKQKDEALNAEQKEQARFDKRLKEEEIWIRQGIKARRTRNEGRVRALKKMREERAMRRDRIGNAKISNQSIAIVRFRKFLMTSQMKFSLGGGVVVVVVVMYVLCACSSLDGRSQNL